ncbi:uncharacterized protein LOC143210718 [Lasioglossum baleicum]|uniref:uncharacterized protein LOC143210718 n=1 Tax=Lasioglossum baleicum TaxID=434251 RepID=UPI003FCC6398
MLEIQKLTRFTDSSTYIVVPFDDCAALAKHKNSLRPLKLESPFPKECINLNLLTSPPNKQSTSHISQGSLKSKVDENKKVGIDLLVGGSSSSELEYTDRSKSVL